MKKCISCGKSGFNDNLNECPECNGMLTEAQPEVNEWIIPTQPMKWYKFLIYFLLFVSALVNFCEGIQMITGDAYMVQSGGQITAEQVYAFAGEKLKYLDVAYGIFLILLAVFTIYTRFLLARRMAKGPSCLYAMYAIAVVGGLIYAFVAANIMQATPEFANLIGRVVGTGVAIKVNHIYFTKRRLYFNEY